MPSSSQLSVASEDTGLDEESESCDIKSQSRVSDTTSSAYSSEIDQLESRSIDTTSDDTESTKEDKTEQDDTGTDIVVASSDAEYSNVEIGDIQEDRSEQSNLSNVNAGSQETLLSIKSLSPSHVIDGRLEIIGQDMNGNPEILEAEVIDPTPMVPVETEEALLAEIGAEIEGVPLVHCVRVICRRFLLCGKAGELMPDRRVRVSVKSLALTNMAFAVKLMPSVFLQRLIQNNTQGMILSSVSKYPGNLLILVGSKVYSKYDGLQN